MTENIETETEAGTETVNAIDATETEIATGTVNATGVIVRLAYNLLVDGKALSYFLPAGRGGRRGGRYDDHWEPDSRRSGGGDVRYPDFMINVTR